MGTKWTPGTLESEPWYLVIPLAKEWSLVWARPLPDEPRLALVPDSRSTWMQLNPHEGETPPTDE
ncbi:MAG: hypothetical protein GY696_18385 [Gammaproteobacteria bacterium]|nr:hypothetical protein [Gammaproteobacteria bacterium]